MIAILLFRLFSGLKNAGFYSKGFISKIFLILAFFGLTLSIVNQAVVGNIFSITALCVTAILICLEVRAFRKGQSQHIHLIETFLTPMFSLALLLNCEDLFTVLVASWVGNTVFNMPINYVSTGAIIEKLDITDDPTGKSYGLYLLGKKYNVPRISNGYLSAGISLGLILVWAFTKNYLNFTLCDIPFINAYLK